MIAHHTLMVMRFSTFDPGARRAARRASCRSAHDRAMPFRDHLAAVGFDGDAVGVELRICGEGILDLALISEAATRV
jgi:hypothetical protein